MLTVGQSNSETDLGHILEVICLRPALYAVETHEIMTIDLPQDSDGGAIWDQASIARATDLTQYELDNQGLRLDILL